MRAETEAKRLFEKLDFNNNGSIDYSEFLITHLDPAKVINEERLREVFNLFDSDKSGAITVDEIKRLLGGGMSPPSNKEFGLEGMLSN
jgi:calcium-dependent protein kinase